MQKNKPLQWIWLIALLAFPIVLWILPSDLFERGDGIILCPSRLFFDIECLGCGITRAVMHLHHFEFEEAIYFNYLVVLVYPALVYVWVLWTYRAAKRLDLLGDFTIRFLEPKKQKVA